jgi:hypothetical protein
MKVGTKSNEPVVDSEIQEIHQENKKKIKEMSKKEVEAELE